MSVSPGDLSSRKAGLSPEQRARLEARLAGEAAAPEIPRRPANGPAPLSFAQQRLWFLDRLAPGQATYNMPLALALDGPLDAGALARALAEVTRRHDALRTTIGVVDDRPVQLVAAEGAPLAIVDVRADELDARLAAEARAPFELARGPLVRATLFRAGETHHVLAVTAHHIVFDGWSASLLFSELWAAYDAFTSGRAPALPELPVQYVDYAAWQRERLSGALVDEQLRYWTLQLEGAPPLHALPADRPRPPRQSQRGATRARVLPKELLDGVRALARASNTTAYATLLAAFVALLRRYGGQDDVVVGSPIADRGWLEVEPLIGFFVNTVALRVATSGNPTFRELVARAREVVGGALANQDAPFDRLVEELKPERSQSYSPIFQVLFQYDEHGPATRQVGALRVREHWTQSATAKFDLSLQLAATGDGLRTAIEYATDLYDDATIERMLGHFHALLAAAVANPDAPIAALPLLGDDERRALLAWNDTARDYRRVPVHVLAAEQAARTPDAPALVRGDERMTYGELDRRANQLAHHLVGLGARGKLVALALDPSFELAVAVLATLKAGAACVPLDPTHPRERLSQLIGETSPPVLLTQQHLAGRIPAYDATVLKLDREWAQVAGEPDTAPDASVAQDDLAYVIYTSGSTGRPKGACLPHRVLSNLIAWYAQALPGAARMLQFAPLAFDISFYELFTTFASGGTLVLGDPAMRRDMELLGATIARERVETVVLPAVVLAQLAEHVRADASPLASLRAVISTGEQLRVTGDVARLFARLDGCRLHNHYGPSETHVVTAYTLPAQAAAWPALPPIGRPIANTRIVVLDDGGELAPIGVPGELCIAGDAVGRGYLDRDELTATRFAETAAHGRVYRTGDLARWRADGQLEFLARLDDQVKLRGLRIELGEIEAVLAEHADVKEAVAVVREDTPGDQRLVAYFVAAGQTQAAPSAVELRTHLARRLPAHMIPSVFAPLARLPLTPRGKVDRRALPPPAAAPDETHYVAPRNETEARVAEIFAQLLGLPRVGVDDNFFEIGGHSLLATQATAHVSRAFGVRLMVRRLFEAPTAAQIAEEIRKLAGGAPGAQKIARRADLATYPVSHIQERTLSSHRHAPDAPEIVPLAYRFDGPLDVRALERAVHELTRRHEILRARFSWDGEKYTQTIAAEVAPFAVVAIPGDEAAATQGAVEMARALAREPLDTRTSELFRVRLVRVAPERHLVILFVHHAMWDGVSATVFVSELAALHDAFARGEPSPLAELPFQYADFAAWQRAFYASPEGAAQIAWWQREVDGAVPPALPTDHPREAVDARRREMTNYPFPRGAARLPERAGQFARVQACARRHTATPYELLISAFVTWLHRRTGQDDLAIATQHQNRHLDGTERLVGVFAQAFVARTRIAGDPTFGELLERTRQTLLAARAHADVCGPFQQLSRFRVNFNFFPHLVRHEPRPGGVTVRAWDVIDLGRTFWYDLTLHATVMGGELWMLLWFNQELWTQATAERFLAEYGAVLEQVLANPELRLSQLAI
jgi:amino acid adenylation domain-containing protein